MVFKEGDIVECVDNSGVKGLLTIGEHYTIYEYSALYCNVKLKELSFIWFDPDRFKLVQPKETTVTTKCTCSNHQLFYGGCICGAIDKYEV